MLSIDEARAAVLAAVQPLGAGPVPLADAHDRILAEDIAAAHDVPPFDNSAMDGYAVRGTGPEFTVIGESRAGAPFDGAVDDDQAVTISTGAALPAGATAVVPIERAVLGAQQAPNTAQVWLEGEIRTGDNVRRAGEDLQAGATVLQRGMRVGPAELGVAASAGRAAVQVAQRPRVAIVATGDELQPPGAALAPGQIHETNALSLAALSRAANAQVVGVTHASDNRPDTQRALEAALTNADVVLISGGVSVGPHDHVKPALEALNVEEHFWRVALRPGKPTWFGTRDNKLVFGLPGNPVSAIVTFVLFARPALAALQGATPDTARRTVQLAQPIPRHPNRDEAIRVRIDSEGAAEPTGPQGSHQLSSLLHADGLAIIPRGEGELPAGTHVELEPLP